VRPRHQPLLRRAHIHRVLVGVLPLLAAGLGRALAALLAAPRSAACNRGGHGGCSGAGPAFASALRGGLPPRLSHRPSLAVDDLCGGHPQVMTSGRRPRPCSAQALSTDTASPTKEGNEVPRLEDGQASALVFMGTYLAYAASYLARNNAAVAKASLLDLPSLSSLVYPLSGTTLLGFLDAGFLTAYAFGSFVLPAVLDLDEREPWSIVQAALAITALSQLVLCSAWVFALGQSFGAWQLSFALACCVLNGLAQSVLYPTCKQLMADKFGSNGTVLGTWNTCYYLGGVVSTLIAAAFCDNLGWPFAFFGPGILLVLVAGVVSGVSWLLSVEGDRPETVTGISAEAEGPRSSLQERLGQLVQPSSLDICVVAAQYFAVKLIRYAFGLWLPLLLVASRGGLADTGLLEVGRTAAIFDIGSVVGSLAVGAQAEYLGKGTLPFLVLATSFALALLLPQVPLLVAGDAAAPLDGTLLNPPLIILLALGGATGGAETLLGSICPIYYAQLGGSSVASAVASVNGYGSLGTVASALVLPLLAGSSEASDLAAGFASLAPLAGLAALAAAAQCALKGDARSEDVLE